MASLASADIDGLKGRLVRDMVEQAARHGERAVPSGEAGA